MLSALNQVIEIISQNVPWMGWNLFLALLPWGLSLWLFRWQRGGSALWWLGVVVFIAFLPNAPYVLTDVIHLIQNIQRFSSPWIITLVIIPIFVAFMFTGFEAYVLALINLGYFLHRRRKRHWILPIETSLHGLSAIGIYLGRFLRLNSWDLVTQPHAVLNTTFDTLTRKQPVVVTLITFLIVSGLYAIFKFLTLAVTGRDFSSSIQRSSDS